MNLNRRRRVGVVLAVLWLLCVLGLTLTEYAAGSNSYLVYQAIPPGTTVEGNKVTLPDGRTITISEEDEFAMRYKLEQDLDHIKRGVPLRPWDIDWSKLEGVPKHAEVRWGLFATLALVFPAMAWLLTEATVLVVAWVKRGSA